MQHEGSYITRAIDTLILYNVSPYVVVRMESRDDAENLEEIASIDGLDVCLLGELQYSLTRSYSDLIT